MLKAPLALRPARASPRSTHDYRADAVALAASLICFAWTPEPLASGFLICEQSATALGNAFAGAVAGGDDLTYMFFNGASLTRQHGSQVAVVGTSILSQAKVHDAEGSTAAGVGIGGGDGGRNAGTTSLIPALYAMWDVSESFAWGQAVRLGLAINAPFGFETEYEDDWVGRYHAIDSRLRTIDINPVLGYQPLPGLSLAIGLQAQYIDAKLTNAIDFGSLGQANGISTAVPTRQDGLAMLTGNDWGFGLTAGLLLEPWPGTRLGVAYRSQVSHDVAGNARFRLDDAGTGAILRGASGAFQDTAAQAHLTTPETVAIGIHQDIDAAWAVDANVTWTRWSRFRQQKVTFDNPAQPDEVTEEDWRDTLFVALGGTWRPDEDWTLRSGVAYDQSPSRNKTRTPRAPANNGVLLAVGASFAPPDRNYAVSFGYSHSFIESARIGLKASEPGNAARGSLSGSSRNAVDTLSLQITWSF